MSGVMASRGTEGPGRPAPASPSTTCCPARPPRSAVSSALFQRRPYRQGGLRCLHAGGDAGVPVGASAANSLGAQAIVSDCPESGREPQADRQSVRGGEGYCCGRATARERCRALMIASPRRRAWRDSRCADWSRQESRLALREHHRWSVVGEDRAHGRRSSTPPSAPCASVWKIEEVIDDPRFRGAPARCRRSNTPLWRLRSPAAALRLAPWRRPALKFGSAPTLQRPRRRGARLRRLMSASAIAVYTRAMSSERAWERGLVNAMGVGLFAHARKTSAAIYGAARVQIRALR